MEGRGARARRHTLTDAVAMRASGFECASSSYPKQSPLWMSIGPPPPRPLGEYSHVPDGRAWKVSGRQVEGRGRSAGGTWKGMECQ